MSRISNALCSRVRNIAEELTESNMFIRAEDKAEIESQVKNINHEIAQNRYDIQKLLYGV